MPILTLESKEDDKDYKLEMYYNLEIKNKVRRMSLMLELKNLFLIFS